MINNVSLLIIKNDVGFYSTATVNELISLVGELKGELTHSQKVDLHIAIKNTKLKRMYNVNFLKSTFYEKEDKETIINLNIKYKKILKILSKKGSKKKFLRIIALLTNKKKNYLHLDSYENKKIDLIDTFNKIYNLLK